MHTVILNQSETFILSRARKRTIRIWINGCQGLFLGLSFSFFARQAAVQTSNILREFVYTKALFLEKGLLRV